MLAVIIPAYNNPDLLEEGLMSLTLQNYKKFITVVVDDCSPTDLKPTIDKFENKLQIKYIRKEKNEGQGLARQAGIDWAFENHIAYVMFMDQDDLLYPNAVQDLYKTAMAKSAEVVKSPIHQEDLKHQRDYTINNNENWVWTHGKIYNTFFLNKYNIRFDDKIRYNEDGFFNLQVDNYAEKYFGIENVYYRWRDNPNSITREKNHVFNKICYRDIIQGYTKAIKKLLDDDKLKRPIFAISLLYNHYQDMLIERQIQKEFGEYKFDNILEVDKTIREIVSNPKLAEEFKTKKARRKTAQAIKNCYLGIKSDQPYKEYPMTFFRWLSLFGGEQIIKNLSEESK